MFLAESEFGAAQKYPTTLDLENAAPREFTVVVRIGFDTHENGP